MSSCLSMTTNSGTDVVVNTLRTFRKQLLSERLASLVTLVAMTHAIRKMGRRLCVCTAGGWLVTSCSTIAYASTSSLSVILSRETTSSTKSKAAQRRGMPIEGCGSDQTNEIMPSGALGPHSG